MEFCKNAHPISEFKERMLNRKKTLILKYFQNHSMLHDFNELNGFYKSNNSLLSKVNTKWYNVIKKVNNYFDKLPNFMLKDNISYYKNELSRALNINLNDIKLNKEQVKIKKYVDILTKLEVMNSKIFRFMEVVVFLWE